MGKFIAKEELVDLRAKIKAQGQTLVTTNGCFDILHVGHVKYLQKSKEFGDILMVLLNSDKSVRAIKGEGRPVNNENDRAYLLCALNCVDYVVLFDEESPQDLLDNIKPDIHTKGEDYTIDTLPEADVILKNGGRVEFIKFVEGKSTTNILKKLKS
jgi:rfaE bifunctional protein nucleotidyltransferase chain/domain